MAEKILIEPSPALLQKIREAIGAVQPGTHGQVTCRLDDQGTITASVAVKGTRKRVEYTVGAFVSKSKAGGAQGGVEATVSFE